MSFMAIECTPSCRGDEGASKGGRGGMKVDRTCKEVGGDQDGGHAGLEEALIAIE
jgi:hypothetical protein